MKQKKHLISSRMYTFLTMGILLLALLACFYFSMSGIYEKDIRSSADRELSAILDASVASVGDRLGAMSDVAMNILYSNTALDSFRSLSSAYLGNKDSGSGLAEARQKILQISDFVFASMSGTFMKVSQVNIYSLNGLVARVGYNTSIEEMPTDSIPYFRETMELEGKRHLSLPVVHTEIPSYKADRKTRKYLSLSHLFFNRFHQPEGIVEVIQDCDEIFSMPEEQTGNRTRILIYNADGIQVFPFADGAESVPLSSLSMADVMVRLEDGDLYLIKSSEIEKYGWKVFVLMSDSSVRSSLARLRNNLVMATCLILAILLVACFFISSRLTRPIDALRNAAEDTNLETILANAPSMKPDVRIKEIDVLWDSFDAMKETIRTTTDQVLLLRSEEQKAQLMMLVSFVKPHFLYNCISTISALAESGLDEQVVAMCSSLTKYLRYISSASAELMVPFKDEAENIRSYLEIMHVRFSKGLSYEIRYDEVYENVLIPKLITQPIIENAFKYSFNRRPPWTITVDFMVEGGYWKIRIEDNGGNFKEEQIEEMMHSFASLDLATEPKNLQIGKAGLKNIYLRLKMRYGDDFIFRITNEEGKRTTFLIGGRIG